MEKNISKQQEIEQGLDFWENEVEYFTNAIQGLRSAYAILSSMRERAIERVKELTPEREEVS